MQLHMPELSRSNKIIIISLSAFFVLEFFTSFIFNYSLSPVLSLSFQGLKSGIITQVFTYILVSKSIISFVFSMMIVWFMGYELEANWGKSFYLKYLSLAVLSSGVFFTLLVLIFPSLRLSALSGIDSLSYALLVGYAMVYPERPLSFMFLFPVKALYFCILIAIISFFNALGQSGAASAWVQLFALVFSYAYLKYLSYTAQNGSIWKRKKNPKKSHLRIVEDDEEKPKYWH